MMSNLDDLKQSAKEAYAKMGKAMQDLMEMPGGLLLDAPLRRAIDSNDPARIRTFTENCDKATEEIKQIIK